MPSRRSLLLLPAALLPALPAWAADLKVLTAGAFKPVLLALQPAFEQATGHRLRTDNDTAGALQKRVLAGDPFDVVFSSAATLEAMQAAGKLRPGSVVPLMRGGIGVAVAAGGPRPDLSSVEGFRAMLLGARRIAVIDPAAGGSSGIYLARLFERLGLVEALRGKLVPVPGGLTAQRIVQGDADVAIQQYSEILAVPGVTHAGLLPAAVQNYTAYGGAVSAGTGNAGAALQLLAAMQSAEADRVLAQHGLERAR